MLKDLINKLKEKQQFINEKKVQEETKSSIIISKQNNIFKVEISSYITGKDYINKFKSNDNYNVLSLICNNLLWNSHKQKINKGVYYVIIIDNSIYNILLADDRIEIDERTKIKLDEEFQKENIILERLITFYIKDNEYEYYSAKHERNGNTYYNKYYIKNNLSVLKNLELTKKETYEEINSIICNLENIDGIETILEIELLKKYILKDLYKEHVLTKIKI